VVVALQNATRELGYVPRDDSADRLYGDAKVSSLH
jgi:hypothetical protein